MSMSSGKHYPALDGLRGLAILLVIAHNGLTMDLDRASSLGKVIYKLLDTGWIGVTLFFALSGFLITGILLDTQGKPRAWLNFTVRRALRIFPPYYLALIVLLLLLPAIGLAPAGVEDSRDNQVWLWTYLINWFQSTGHGVAAVPHFWSLAIEEQFYLVWPLVIFACRSPRQVMWACLFTAAISIGTRAWMARQGGMEDMIYTFTVTRMDALAFGGLAAWAMREQGLVDWLSRHRIPVLASLSALTLATLGYTHLLGRTSERSFTVGYAVLGLVFAYWVLALALRDRAGIAGPASAWARSRLLGGIGLVSYGMYIVHKPLNDFVLLPMAQRQGWDVGSLLGGLLYLVALTAASYGVAKLSFHAFEQPILRLKRHFA